MPINPVSAAAGTANKGIVRDLAYACINRFFDVRGARAGIGNGSCCASILLVAPSLIWGADYRFGSSQAHILDPDAVNVGGMFNPQHHAERQAHAAAAGAAYVPHLFVELPPCGGVNGCAAWCGATIPGVNVWYLYPNTGAMTAAHAAGSAAQFAAVDAACPA